MIDIVITDGGQNSQVLDILGKGSVLGSNFVFKSEQWAYRAVNQTEITACAIKVSFQDLVHLSNKHQDLAKALYVQRDYLKNHGISQIDYVIEQIKI